MYSNSVYNKWHAIIVDVSVFDQTFDQLCNWCQIQFGKRQRPNNLWDWGTNAGYSLWFAFKNKDDCVLFVLTWGNYVRTI